MDAEHDPEAEAKVDFPVELSPRPLQDVLTPCLTTVRRNVSFLDKQHRVSAHCPMGQ